ncbi:MAG: hypothetical protein ACRD0A_04840 [Acidimicrobiales bacterium]
MPVDEGARHKLYIAAEQTLGLENAETLMSLLPPVGWADVATKQDVALVQRDVDRVRQDLAALEDRMNVRFESLEHKFDARFESLEHRFDARLESLEHTFDSKLESLEHKFDSKLESGLRAQTRTFVTWLLASQASTVTMVVAAIALFR